MSSRVSKFESRASEDDRDEIETREASLRKGAPLGDHRLRQTKRRNGDALLGEEGDPLRGEKGGRWTMRVVR